MEVVRQGSSISEHMRRFEDGGKYRSIPFLQWRVVDFRENTSRARDGHPNKMVVYFGGDFSTVEIFVNQENLCNLKLLI